MDNDLTFQEPFYIKKFMEIQQQNVVLYKTLLKIQENPETALVVKHQLGNDVFDILKDCPA
jgi:hypothetical protein